MENRGIRTESTVFLVLFVATFAFFLAAVSIAIAQEPEAGQLTAQLRGGGLYNRLKAAEALEQMGPAAVPALINLLRNDDHLVRIEATHILRKIGPAAVPALTDSIRDRDSRVRFHALVTLARMGPEAKAAIPTIAEALRDPSWGVQAAAVLALQEMGSEAKCVIPQLVDVLGDPDPNLPVVVRRILRDMGPDVVPALTEMARNATGKARYHAIVTLGRIGAAASSAVPAIQTALNDERSDVRTAAAEALQQIAEASAVPGRVNK